MVISALVGGLILAGNIQNSITGSMPSSEAPLQTRTRKAAKTEDVLRNRQLIVKQS